MLGLSHRVVRLERARKMTVQCCAVCGDGPGGIDAYTCSLAGWDDGHLNDGPDRCPGCGRRRVFRIEFDERG